MGNTGSANRGPSIFADLQGLPGVSGQRRCSDDADTDPRVAEAVEALNIRYVLTSTPVVRGFVMPDGLVSLDSSRSWEKIYDNGEARIYRWHGENAAKKTTN